MITTKTQNRAKRPAKRNLHNERHKENQGSVEIFLCKTVFLKKKMTPFFLKTIPMRLFNFDMDIHRENGRSGLTEKEGNSQKNQFLYHTNHAKNQSPCFRYSANNNNNTRQNIDLLCQPPSPVTKAHPHDVLLIPFSLNIALKFLRRQKPILFVCLRKKC